MDRMSGGMLTNEEKHCQDAKPDEKCKAWASFMTGKKLGSTHLGHAKG